MPLEAKDINHMLMIPEKSSIYSMAFKKMKTITIIDLFDIPEYIISTRN